MSYNKQEYIDNLTVKLKDLEIAKQLTPTKDDEVIENEIQQKKSMRELPEIPDEQPENET